MFLETDNLSQMKHVSTPQQDGTRTCVLDSRLRCRRVLNFPSPSQDEEDEEVSEDDVRSDEEKMVTEEEAAEAEKLHNSRRHVKRRLASLFIKWLKLEEENRRRRLMAAAE